MKNKFYELGMGDCENCKVMGKALNRYKRLTEKQKDDYLRGYKEMEMSIITKIYSNFYV